MILINKDTIFKLNPCKDRFNNFVKFYGNRSFCIKQFMGLKNISHADKLWVSLRLINPKHIRFIAADIAENVLHLFENYYPTDSRPRIAIKVARGDQIDGAAHATHAAFAAAHDAAAFAAVHAVDAAYAVDAAAYAAYAAAHAAVDSIAYVIDAAAHAAAHDDTEKLKQQKLHRTIIIKYWLKECHV